MVNNKITVATHNGTFHLDDLLSIALIKLVEDSSEIEVIRTRNESIIDSCDWVVDVGGEYDHDRRRYDHHQIDSPVRDNGVPYAAFGLLWRHWGDELCGSKKAADLMDVEFVQMVDGPDNGFVTYQSLVSEGYVPSLSMLAHIWQAEDGGDNAFNELVDIIKKILVKIIRFYVIKIDQDQIFKESYINSASKDIIFVPKGVKPLNISAYPEVKFIAYRDLDNDTWKAKCVSEADFKCRKSFPVNWRGLKGDKLRNISGITGAEFVHQAGFLAVTSNKEDLIKMCHVAIKE